jgi:hypothetical protein
VLVLALIAFLIIRRQRYVRALRGHGWIFEFRPALESVLDHHAPPFGLGFVPSPVRQLPTCRSECSSTKTARVGRDLTTASQACSCPCRSQISSYPPTKCVAAYRQHPSRSIRVSRYAPPTLDMRAWRCPPRVLEAIGAFGQAGHRLDLSIDGERLVAVGAPKDPDQLQAYLELLVGSLRPSTQLAWRRTRWRRRRLDSASTAIPTGS